MTKKRDEKFLTIALVVVILVCVFSLILLNVNFFGEEQDSGPLSENVGQVGLQIIPPSADNNGNPQES